MNHIFVRSLVVVALDGCRPAVNKILIVVCTLFQQHILVEDVVLGIVFHPELWGHLPIGEIAVEIYTLAVEQSRCFKAETSLEVFSLDRLIIDVQGMDKESSVLILII